jgi:hypothetical protein
MVARCSATNASGDACGAQAWRDGLCAWHHPDRAAEMAEARRRGGRAKGNKARAKREMIDAALSPKELQGVIAVTLKAVLAERKSPAIGSAIASLARAAVAVREATDLEDRLDALEAAAGIGERRA